MNILHILGVLILIAVLIAAYNDYRWYRFRKKMKDEHNIDLDRLI